MRAARDKEAGLHSGGAPGQKRETSFYLGKVSGCQRHMTYEHQWRPSPACNKTELKEIISSPDPPLLTPGPPVSHTALPWPSSPPTLLPCTHASPQF